MGIIRAEGGKSGVKRERLSYCIDSRRWVVCPFDTSPPRGRNAFRDGFPRNASCAPWVRRFRTARRFWRIRILPCRCWSQHIFLSHRNQSNSFPSRKMVKVAHYPAFYLLRKAQRREYTFADTFSLEIGGRMATIVRRHQNDTKTFEELSSKEQALAVNAHTVWYLKAARAHGPQNRANEGHRENR